MSIDGSPRKGVEERIARGAEAHPTGDGTRLRGASLSNVGAKISSLGAVVPIPFPRRI